MDRIIFHIDVNSAYLSWSALKYLSAGETTDLRNIPSIIGGDMEKRHGVVLAKSIYAKKYGVTTGEPIVNALRKCPFLVLRPPDQALYHERSRELMEFLYGICPDIEQVSVDECYMDFTPVADRYLNFKEGAAYIRDSVRNQFNYTVNIGISDKKVLAKMASDFKKPDMTHTLFSREIKEKMWPLPVSSLFLCGSSSVTALKNLGIITIGDLACSNRDILASHLKSHGLTLWEYANGIDDSPVATAAPEIKGIGNSTTLSKDAITEEDAYMPLLALAESVGKRLRSSAQLSGIISVEIKYSDFQAVSHQTMLFTPTNTTQIIYDTACSLFKELWNGSPIRLLGIRTSKLTAASEPAQISLFEYEDLLRETSELNSTGYLTPTPSRLARLDQTLDCIRQKFGEDSVVRGSLLSGHSRKNKHK